MGEVYILVSGVQLAVFLGVFFMSLLIQRDKIAKLFTVVSFLFVIISLAEFLHVFSNIYVEMAPWLSTTAKLFMITHPIYLLIGILILFSLKQLKDE
jgi:hypothetical protein